MITTKAGGYGQEGIVPTGGTVFGLRHYTCTLCTVGVANTGREREYCTLGVSEIGIVFNDVRRYPVLLIVTKWMLQWLHITCK